MIKNVIKLKEYPFIYLLGLGLQSATVIWAVD